MVNGAPVDVFASADTDTMDKAVARKAVNAADVKVFTSNQLVLVTPANSLAVMTQLVDLKKPDIKRFAMGLPASVWYCLGPAAPAREPVPAQGMSAQQRGAAVGARLMSLSSVMVWPAF